MGLGRHFPERDAGGSRQRREHARRWWRWGLLALALGALRAHAAPLTVAVLEVEATSPGLRERATQLGGLVRMRLAERGAGELVVVEAATVEAAQHELARASEPVTAEAAVVSRLGQLTGAKVIVLARAVGKGNEAMVVAKIVGTETGRSIMTLETLGTLPLGKVADELARKVATTVVQRSELFAAATRAQPPGHELTGATRPATAPEGAASDEEALRSVGADDRAG